MTYTPNPNWILKAKNVTLIGIAAEIIGCDRRQIQRYMERGQIKWVYIEESNPRRQRILYKPDVLKIKAQRESGEI